MNRKVIAISGSYRHNGITDQTIDAILDVARQKGAQTKIIRLADEKIEFCTNCRTCTNNNPDQTRGKCVLSDGMSAIMDAIDEADCIILASPINFSTVTALMKRFVERCLAYAWWPWGMFCPKSRVQTKKKAVVITSSGCPAFIGRWLMPNAIGVLKQTVQMAGAPSVKSLYFGLVCNTKDQRLTSGQQHKARSLATWLVA